MHKGLKHTTAGSGMHGISQSDPSLRCHSIHATQSAHRPPVGANSLSPCNAQSAKATAHPTPRPRDTVVSAHREDHISKSSQKISFSDEGSLSRNRLLPVSNKTVRRKGTTKAQQQWRLLQIFSLIFKEKIRLGLRLFLAASISGKPIALAHMVVSLVRVLKLLGMFPTRLL